METYTVRKAQEPTRKPWMLLRRYEEGRVPQILNHYETRKQALTAGRLLAGWRGSVEIERG